MRRSSAFSLLLLGLTCVGCGQPTRETAADEQVMRAVDELARGRPVLAEARLLAALRLDPASARAGALLDLVQPERGELVLEFYDVRDVISAVVEFPAPEISLRLTSGADGGGSTDGVLTFDEETRDDGPGNIDGDKLVEIIEGKLGEDEAGSVELSAGVLIIRKSLAGHEKVVKLLDALRRSAGVMVTVETRSLPLSADFLEHVGIDLNR